MKFNDTSNTHDSLAHEINFLCDANNTTFPLADKARGLNIALQDLLGEIIMSDGGWQFDDTNFTDLPIGTGTLVEGQVSYSFASEYLSIEAIEVKDTNSLWRRLGSLDHLDLNGMSPEEYFGINSDGTIVKAFPTNYDVLGDTIFIYPAPSSSDLTLSSGLRIWFKRTIDLFTASDTIQEPPIPSTYHGLLAYMVSLPYCMKFKKDRVALYKDQIKELRKALMDFYGRREKYKKPKFIPRTKNYR